MELQWRPLRLDDTVQLAKVFAASEALDPTGEHYSADDLREEFDSPLLDLDEASIAGWDGDRLVAYGLVQRREEANPEHKMRVEGIVHPDYREPGVAGYLADFFVRAGKRVHAKTFPDAPLELHGHASESQGWMTDVFEGHGYRRSRTLIDMRAPFETLPPVKPLPVELPLVPYEDKYEELTRLAVNETFAGHWGSAAQSPEGFRHNIAGHKDFQPDLSFLLLSADRDEVVAYVLSAFFESDAEATGVRELYVSHVGTRAALRGRGVATALLGHTLAEAKARGFQRSVLNVDLENVNGALGIYERCGYGVDLRWFNFIHPVE
ncbi:Acetyltransferase (GNAT) family protein [Amycolatopsis xylanica]|uniref:Acetyltransferase (GNAT) family protein n=1 Tax=Amycolatopsis xylanica TaxID=589385 RepID=A0A1H3SZT8_9PSEU|nr:GNAT family N-acetyltransferase [Amycolatopsis xylanica]SDZ43091.1 Acetyltransferase (GNAT) family protein [Amycolatopsis xylanica]